MLRAPNAEAGAAYSHPEVKSRRSGGVEGPFPSDRGADELGAVKEDPHGQRARVASKLDRVRHVSAPP